MNRREILFFACAGLLSCASGPGSTLRSLGTPTGSGPVRFEVANHTDAIVNNLFMADSEAVSSAGRAAFEDGSPEQAALWGADLLRSGLETGGKVTVPVSSPGRYDIRAVARGGEREQRVTKIRLEAGGRYVLELREGGWRPVR